MLGIAHSSSRSALLLRYWLASAGVNPHRDVSLRVLPPSLMGEALRGGEIDGFFAGEPWNGAAIAEGSGELVATGAGLWRRGVEKVLAMREDWAEANPETVDALLRALDRAARWCDDPAHHDELAALLAMPEHLDQPAALIRAALAGELPPSRGAPAMPVPDFLMFNREAANFPWRSQALWIYSQLVRWRMATADPGAQAAAAAVFRSDLYRRALGGGSTPMPGASLKVEGALDAPLAVGSDRGALTLGPDRFFDGRVFDPDALDAYLAGFGAS